MLAARPAPSIATMASTSSPTPTRISSARSPSMFIRCDSPRAICGATKPLRAIQSISTCGTITLTQPDPIPADPVFAEPWEAQAFALAVRLSAQGYFTWKEWAAALAAEIKAAADRGEPDDGTRYYHHWLAALERLVTEKGLSDPEAMRERK